MLLVGMFGQFAGTLVVSTPPFLIPYLHMAQGVDLVRAAAIASAPALGTMISLVVWGAAADRYGERSAMAAGLAVVVAGGVGATMSSSVTALTIWFFICGVGAASAHAASGRLVIGWFAVGQRGLAMGIRQTALPLGTGAAAIIAPNLVEAAGMSVTSATMTVVAIAALIGSLRIVDPPRPATSTTADGRAPNPYRRDATLPRVHLASALLVVPQYAIWAFLLLWLVEARGWSTASASALVAGAHALSAGGRILAGWWSDRVGSRLRPMRIVAASAAVIMLGLGLLESTGVGVALAVLATVVTVSDNGLAFTAVAERAGPFWSGRALGVQNTGQYLSAAATPPVLGLVVAAHGYGWAFGCAAAFAALAVGVIPIGDRSDRAGWG